MSPSRCSAPMSILERERENLERESQKEEEERKKSKKLDEER